MRYILLYFIISLYIILLVSRYNVLRKKIHLILILGIAIVFLYADKNNRIILEIFFGTIARAFSSAVSWVSNNVVQPIIQKIVCPVANVWDPAGIYDKTCPLDCKEGGWTDWSPCSAPCDGGTQSQTLRIIAEARNGGRGCPSQRTNTRQCNTRPCNKDCDYTEGKWTKCSKPCNGGIQTKTNIIREQAIGKGKPCPPAVLSEECNLESCDCDFRYTDWSGCTKECGDAGTQERDLVILRGPIADGKRCPLLKTEKRGCNRKKCPVDCVVSSWTNATKCEAVKGK